MIDFYRINNGYLDFLKQYDSKKYDDAYGEILLIVGCGIDSSS